jgi:hypothetical protein
VGKITVGSFRDFDVIWYLGRNSCMMMVMLYVVSLLSQSHRADAKRATRPDDVVEVAAYSEVSKKIGNVICRVSPLPVSPD